MKIVVPAEFAAGIVNQAGAAGRAWLDRLPTIIASLCERWGLVVDAAPLHGYLGLVVPVRRGTELCALKVSWRDEATVQEMAALAAWNGRGAVRLLDSDPALNAMPLERLDSRRTLQDVPVGEALAIAGRLLRRLAVPAPPALPRLKDVAGRLAAALPERWEMLGRPMARQRIDAAHDQATRLAPTAGALMVNWDFHYGNVLAGEREPWLAIDPKVVVGDPEFGAAQLLWTRLEEIVDVGGLDRHFAALVERAELDLELARAWTFVRCVDYWLWGLSVGLTEDPARCQVIVDWLAT